MTKIDVMLSPGYAPVSEPGAPAPREAADRAREAVPMMTIWAECIVSAAHRFAQYDMHGHTYTVRVSVREGVDGFLNAESFRDELMRIRQGVDHRCLNDVLETPTMEELARWFAREVRKEGFDVTEVQITRPEGVGCRLSL
jgi:6-pyruvoyltetrahydropterin/6-carboxytetrahydropterin synthase